MNRRHRTSAGANGSKRLPSGRGVSPIHFLNAFAPLALALKLADASPSLVFFASALAVIPAAALMSEATEQLSARSGPGVAGLLNVTFGNAPELIIAFIALLDGLQELVKASLVGSVIGNSLQSSARQ